MKKRRALALLLALSLSVSMNGMTVLATASGSGEPFVTTEEGSDVSGKEETSGSQENAGDETPKDEQTGSENTGGETNPGGSSEGEGTSGSENNGENSGSPEDPDKKDESGDPDNTGGQNPGDEDNKEEKPSGGEGETKPGEENPEEKDPAVEENPEEVKPGDEKAEESVSENTVEEEEQDETAAIRMMSFTDEVGLRVTYNAAEADGYQYTIDTDGTLTGITKKDGGDVEGNIVLDEDKGIKKIAAGAFAGNTKITYIKMPSGITAICENAFKGCTALKGMTIPSGVAVIEEGAFEGCTGLTQFALPASVKSIGDRAFAGASKLFMVYMRNHDISKLQTIGNEAFRGCSALVEFCSDTEFTFPDGLETIGEYAFEGCRAITAITFSENITTMGAHVFETCTSLSKVNLPKNLGSIPQYAFADCRSLELVNFGEENQTETIESYAFKGCYNLGSVKFSGYVEMVKAFAFIECSHLVRVEIPQVKCDFEDNAFPDKDTLYLIGYPGSKTEKYTENRKIQFASIKGGEEEKYYQWECKKTGNDISDSDLEKIQIKVSRSSSNPNDDPNKVDNGGENLKGVAAGTDLYVSVSIPSNLKIALVPGSLKCNGEPITSRNGYWPFKMPQGGAMITAEFEYTSTSGTIKGTDVKWELSNGDKLKIGQTTRLFLLDTDDQIIPSSKIKFTSKKPTIASVSSTGMIKGLKAGYVNIEVTVTGGSGKITKQIPVEIVKTDVVSLKLTATSYNKNIFTIDDTIVSGNKVQIASVDKIAVSAGKAKASLELKVQGYDADEDAVSTAVKWTTSDAKVAKLARTSTTDAAPTNTITIPNGTTGEATITATATGADKKTITQKFIIRVVDRTPRLSASALTLNLEKDAGVDLRVISAYEGNIETDAGTFKLVYANEDTVEATEFAGELVEDSSNGVYRYVIKAKSNQIDKGTYNLKVSLNNGTYKIPLKITVTSTLPNPKVAFDKKQPKIDLFLANDGTEVKPVVTNLGSEKIDSYSLEPLTSSENDAYFTKNFQIDPETGVITQKNANMIYTPNNKLITTGYLVLRFEGYKNSAVKKYKITIPTQTVKRSYKLDKTSDTFYALAAKKTVVLSLLDSKTKKQIVLDNENWTVTLSNKSSLETIENGDISINSDGKIAVVVDASMGGGKIVLSVRNNEWASNRAFEYTYTVKTTTSTPKIKLKATTVTLNSQYPDQTGEFALVSNQYDTVLAQTQIFNPVSTAKTAAEYEKIHVDYSDGVGTVSFDLKDSMIKAGTYKFKSEPIESDDGLQYNVVTLTVKVTNTVPAMTIKGTVALNLLAKKSNGAYTETAESQLNVKLPEGYKIDPEKTVDSILCTTKGTSNIEDKFNWDIQEDKLLVSLLAPVTAKQYSFTMTPVYTNQDKSNSVTGKAIKFNVKVYTGTPSVKLSAKGALNLLDRQGEYTLKNSIVWTPTVSNLKDKVTDVKIFDVIGNNRPGINDEESSYFRAEVLQDGKIYVTPRVDAAVENNKNYQLRVWVKFENYVGSVQEGMWVSGNQKIRTAQKIPKVTLDKSNLDLYLSNKAYTATFTVKPVNGSVGKACEVVFGEKDTKSKESFDITCTPQADGSVKVHVKLKDTVSYAGNSTSKITMYVMFEGQGIKTNGTSVRMNIKINK